MDNDEKSTIKELECPVCFDEFGVSGPHIPFVLTGCGHGICSACLETSAFKQCPLCRAPAFNKPIANRALMDCIPLLKRQSSSPDVEKLKAEMVKQKKEDGELLDAFAEIIADKDNEHSKMVEDLNWAREQCEERTKILDSYTEENRQLRVHASMLQHDLLQERSRSLVSRESTLGKLLEVQSTIRMGYVDVEETILSVRTTDIEKFVHALVAEKTRIDECISNGECVVVDIQKESANLFHNDTGMTLVANDTPLAEFVRCTSHLTDVTPNLKKGEQGYLLIRKAVTDKFLDLLEAIDGCRVKK